MKIYTALQIGDYHLNHCEDYLFTGEIGQDKILWAVMDGCTMGNDSYFMATLTGKLLRKISTEMGLQRNAGREDILYLKFKRLEHHFGLKPTDDIASVRVIG